MKLNSKIVEAQHLHYVQKTVEAFVLLNKSSPRLEKVYKKHLLKKMQ